MAQSRNLSLVILNAALLGFSPQQIKKEMKDFILTARPERSVGSLGHEKAYDYLKARFEKLAAKHQGKVIEHNFEPDVQFAIEYYQKDFDTKVEGKVPPGSRDYEKWKAFTGYAIAFVGGYKGKTGKNLILEFKGTKRPKEVLYVGAHYDSITHNHKSMQFTPDQATDGADDNASGVMAVLAIAQAIAQSKHERTVRFVLFDFEEIFFLGSQALARDLTEGKLAWAPKDETFGGLYNFEMVGWSRKKLKQKPVVKLYTRGAKDPESGSDKVLAQMYVLAAKKVRAKITPVVLGNGFDRSDNWPFWLKHLSSVTISQDWEKDFNEKNYHTSKDRLETLNFDYLSEIIRVGIEAVSNSLKIN